MRDMLTEAAVIIGGLALTVLLAAWLVGCSPHRAAAFTCGSEQQITVVLDHATMCAGMQGWLAIDEAALTVFEVVDHVPGCTLNSHWFPAAGQRSAVLRWSMLCSKGLDLDWAPIFRLRTYVKAPTTITGRVDVAVDPSLRACGATLRAVPVACE